MSSYHMVQNQIMNTPMINSDEIAHWLLTLEKTWRNKVEIEQPILLKNLCDVAGLSYQTILENGELLGTGWMSISPILLDHAGHTSDAYSLLRYRFGHANNGKGERIPLQLWNQFFPAVDDWGIPDTFSAVVELA